MATPSRICRLELLQVLVTRLDLPPRYLTLAVFVLRSYFSLLGFPPT